MMNNKYRKELYYLHKKREARRIRHVQTAKLMIYSIALVMGGAAIWWVLR